MDRLPVGDIRGQKVKVTVKVKVGDIRLPTDRLDVGVDEASFSSRQGGVLGSPHPGRLGPPAAQTARGVARRRRALLGNAGRCAPSDVDTRRSAVRAGYTAGRLGATSCALSLPVSSTVCVHTPCRLGRQDLDFTAHPRVDRQRCLNALLSSNQISKQVSK